MALTCPKCNTPLPQPAEARATRVTCPGCGTRVTIQFAAPPRKPAAPPEGPDDLVALAPGTVLGGFRVDAPLGAGGMASVYRATQLSLHRAVALKVLPQALARDPQFVGRFDRESGILAALNHPNIITIYDKGSDAGYYYFAMELVDGATLRDLITRHEVKPADAFSIVSDVCAALDYAHKKGVVHRDMKPSNVLIDRDGRVKVADFGIAHLARRGETAAAELTMTNMRMGTQHYMAPEQQFDAKSVDARADIYALGVMFYEMLCGQLPLGSFDPPSRKVAGLDARIDAIISKSLKTDPEQRFSSPGEIVTILREIATGAPTAAAAAAAATDAPTLLHPGHDATLVRGTGMQPDPRAVPSGTALGTSATGGPAAPRTPLPARSGAQPERDTTGTFSPPQVSELDRCPRCQYVNRAGARVCLGCGASMTRKCPRCRKDVAIRSETCGGCGLVITDYLEEALTDVRKSLDQVEEMVQVGDYAAAIDRLNALLRTPGEELAGVREKARQRLVEVKELARVETRRRDRAAFAEEPPPAFPGAASAAAAVADLPAAATPFPTAAAAPDIAVAAAASATPVAAVAVAPPPARAGLAIGIAVGVVLLLGAAFAAAWFGKRYVEEKETRYQSDALALANSAAGLEKKGDYAAARDAWQRLVRDFPRSPEAGKGTAGVRRIDDYHAAARKLLQEGKDADAKKQTALAAGKYRAVIDQFPCSDSSAEAKDRSAHLAAAQAEADQRLAAAEAAFDAGRTDESVEKLEAVGRDFPESDAGKRAAQRAAEVRTYAKAAADLMTQGEVAVRAKDCARAFELFSRVVRDYPRAPQAVAAKSAAEVARQEVERIGKRLEDAGTLATSGRTDEAKAAYAQIAADYPGTTWAEKAGRATAAIQEGVARRQAEEDARRRQQEEKQHNAAALAAAREHPIALANVAFPVRRGLGVSVQPVAVKGARGLRVTRVFPGSSGEGAGLVAGQVLLAADKQELGRPEDLAQTLQQINPGGQVTLTVQEGTAPPTFKQVPVGPVWVLAAKGDAELRLEPGELPSLPNNTAPVAYAVLLRNNLFGFAGEGKTHAIEVKLIGPAGQVVGRPKGAEKVDFAAAPELVPLSGELGYNEADPFWAPGIWQLAVFVDKSPLRKIDFVRIENGPWSLCRTCAGSKLCQACSGSRGGACRRCQGKGTIAGPGVCGVCKGAGRTVDCVTCKGQGTVPCLACGGSGMSPIIVAGVRRPCTSCNGQKAVTCPTCRGSRGATCPECHGTGQVPPGGRTTCPDCGGRGSAACPACGGSGNCPECKGEGRVRGR